MRGSMRNKVRIADELMVESAKMTGNINPPERMTLLTFNLRSRCKGFQYILGSSKNYH